MKKVLLIIIILLMGVFATIKIIRYQEKKEKVRLEQIKNQEENKIKNEITRIKEAVEPNKIKYSDNKKIEILLEENEKIDINSKLFRKIIGDKHIKFYYKDKKVFEIKYDFVPKNRLAIIIDDVGRTTRYLDDFHKIDEKINFAVLPFLKKTKECKDFLYKKGYNVILHMPMESLGSEYLNKNTKGLIRTNMKKIEIKDKFEKALEDVGYVPGFNNHMGSKFTSNRDKMEQLMELTKEKGLYYIDSWTTPRSVAYDVAKEKKVKTYQSSVFLDNKKEIDYIKNRIKIAVEKTKEEGKLISIGHYHPATAQAIYEMLDYIKSQDVELVFLPEVLE